MQPPANNTTPAVAAVPAVGNKEKLAITPEKTGDLNGRKVTRLQTILTIGSISLLLLAATVCFLAIPTFEGMALAGAIAAAIIFTVVAGFIATGPGFEVLKSRVPPPENKKKADAETS